MVNYDDLPLFPLHVVLYPEMPLPLHIFEPRYREMILRCREENTPFGISLIQNGDEAGREAIPLRVGTTARIDQYEEMPDWRMNILVIGETRFRIQQTHTRHPYLAAQVEPFWELATDPLLLQAPFDTVSGLFKTYLRALFAMSGRRLSTLQLPQEPECLSFAIASVLQVSLSVKQELLEIRATETRLQREIEILQEEIEAQGVSQGIQEDAMPFDSTVLPVDMQKLSRLSSLN